MLQPSYVITRSLPSSTLQLSTVFVPSSCNKNITQEQKIGIGQSKPTHPPVSLLGVSTPAHTGLLRWTFITEDTQSHM